ncbi:MAG: hypothetical protein AAF988_03185 [Pseudomonadota bacterium]
MKNFFASVAVLTSLTQFLCIFCCVVPAATGLIAMLSLVGISSSENTILSDLSHMLHPYETTIIIVSFVLISLSWIMHFVLRKQENISCECSSKDNKKPIFLIIATGLLGVNIGVMTFLH